MESTGKSRTLRPMSISKDRKTALPQRHPNKRTTTTTQRGIKYRLGISEHLAIINTEPRSRRPSGKGNVSAERKTGKCSEVNVQR
jgi:hypothetical protein